MRKRDENRGKIKESVEKKEYAGKEFPAGVTERLNHAAIIRVKSVFSSTPSLTVGEGWKFHCGNTDGTAIMTCLAVPARSRRPPHAWLGFQALNKCNSLHRACRGSFPAIIRLMRTLKKKKLFLPAYEEMKVISFRFFYYLLVVFHTKQNALL